MTTKLQILNIHEDTNKQYKPNGTITRAKRDKITPGFRPRTSSQAVRQSRVEEAHSQREERERERRPLTPKSELRILAKTMKRLGDETSCALVMNSFS